MQSLSAALLCACIFLTVHAAPINDDVIRTEFAKFIVKYDKTYATAEARAAAFDAFAKTWTFVQKHNARIAAGEKNLHTATINNMADWTDAEYRRLLGARPPSVPLKGGTKYVANMSAAIASSVDWRDQGWVTPVKNQGQCGSCWSFSATGALEGQNARYTGNLISLSEQNLMDCSGNYGNDGCSGGWPSAAFDYVHDQMGIDTEQSYPYEARGDNCRFNTANTGGCDCGHVSIDADEGSLQNAVANIGPISVAIDASHRSFQTYSGDVYSEPACSTTQLDHAVLIVGFGNSNGADYWLIKNSWGTDWGINGYMLMARNAGNMCGIATSASYPQPGCGNSC